MSAIFGGSKSKQQQTQESGNSAFPAIQQAYNGQIANGTKANDTLTSLLTGGPGANEAFDNYKNSTGYQSTLDAGSQAITDNNAAKGMLQSGDTGKALTKFGQNTNQGFFQNFLNSLLGVGNQGLQAGGLVTQAGQYSKGQSSGSSNQKNGLGGLLGRAI